MEVEAHLAAVADLHLHQVVPAGRHLLHQAPARHHRVRARHPQNQHMVVIGPPTHTSITTMACMHTYQVNTLV